MEDESGRSSLAQKEFEGVKIDGPQIERFLESEQFAENRMVLNLTGKSKYHRMNGLFIG